MNWWVSILIVTSTFWIMELVAWATHKYIMHGFLWSLHRDHHQVEKHKKFEKNDAFFLIFAIPGAAFMILGSYFLLVGIGITLYGLAYFIVHEVFIHQRIKWLRNTRIKYFKAIRRAHKIHHKNLNKNNGSCFGMLVVPMKFFRQS